MYLTEMGKCDDYILEISELDLSLRRKGNNEYVAECLC